ncbi:MAG TPA: hypothetical protein VKN14_06675 [Flavobacteriaceae bacterium]|nr:hypothetical protein [Flavobacteriaceae bacterium]
MKKEIKKITLLFLLGSFGLFAQQKDCSQKITALAKKHTCEKSSCCATSCGPTGTKVSEAKVITVLRDKILTLKNELKSKTSYSFNSDLMSKSVPVGENDENSIVLLEEEIKALENELSLKITTFNLLPANKEKFDNKAKLIAYLDTRVEHIKEQVSNL